MPKTKPTRGALPPDELILAAIDRAERHRRNDEPGVLLATIKGHLGFVHNSWTTRLLRPRLEALDATGVVEQSRRHGLDLWGLTERGRELLEGLRSAGKLGDLPEAPQHRYWREARREAGERIAEFREDLRRLLDEVRPLLDDGDATGSDSWFEVSERMQFACGRLASATHCLLEWPEPDDARADIADPLHRGRRNTRLWDRC